MPRIAWRQPLERITSNGELDSTDHALGERDVTPQSPPHELDGRGLGPAVDDGSQLAGIVRYSLLPCVNGLHATRNAADRR
jgi:hypothetical protein